jgi:hypothetical protein
MPITNKGTVSLFGMRAVLLGGGPFGARRKGTVGHCNQQANDEERPEHWDKPKDKPAVRTVTRMVREVRLDALHASFVHATNAPGQSIRSSNRI